MASSASSAAAASTSASAWGWNNNGFNDSWGEVWNDSDFDGGFSMNFNLHGSGRGRDGYNNYRSYHGYGYNAHVPVPLAGLPAPQVATTSK